MTDWRVELLNENVAAEVNGLPTDIRAKFLHIAEMMIAVGPQRMREPHVKPLRDKLWEVRMSGKEGIGRAIYVLASNRRIVVLHAFVKKTQKTPSQAIELALASEGDSAMTVPLKKLRDEWMKDPAFRSEYERLTPEFALARELIKARTKARMTQAQVARRMGTTQSVVARIESGQNAPNLKTLEKYARAVGRRIEVKLIAAA